MRDALIKLGIMIAVALIVVIIIPGAKGFQESKEDNLVSMYEHQSFLCKHKNHVSPDHVITCIIIDDDDYMNKQNLSKLMNKFNNGLDTFDVSELTNMGNMANMGAMK
jgi:ABC-type antimicrobial peptide transport system permease subunit